MTFEQMGIADGDFYSRAFAAKSSRDDTMILNLGPQHPSTHGVLRILVELDGEYVLRAEPILGYLHRMHEKMAENGVPWQFIPNMGRVDYLHALSWNWAYCGAVERLAGLEAPERAQYIRVITAELNRIGSHLVWWGAFTLDLGAISPIMYAFDDREQILDLLQRATGSRLTHSSFRFGGVCADIDDEFIRGCREIIARLKERLPIYKNLVTGNVIFRNRVEGVGVFDQDIIRRYGATGPVARASGIDYDVRVAEPYSIYDRFKWSVPVRQEGDSMARYLIRLDEIEQSLAILEQALDSLPEGPIMMAKAPKPAFSLPKGETYFAVEGARGKIGIHIVASGAKQPYKIKLRAPGFSNLSLYAEAAQGCILADAIAILGSLDLVIPEIDR